ncbi:MAG: adenylosuccinate synthase [Verrucomicrobiota bacterium]
MNTILIGAQWGDEGKGKIIDVLTEEQDAVIRSQGGNNAGHTINIGKKKYVLHLLPTGLLRPGRLGIIGNGCVIDPISLTEEIAGLEKQGVKLNKRLHLSLQAHLVLPYHRYLDGLREDQAKGKRKIGTTRRGIGPTYGDKISRIGLRVCDMADLNHFEKKLLAGFREVNSSLKKQGYKPLTSKPLIKDCLKAAKKLQPYLSDTVTLIHDLRVKKKKLLFEGAQGTFLDIDFGTYPYVTSSNTTAGGACTGTGLPPMAVDRVIGAMKAYTTRVGEGPFPTENNELGDLLHGMGREFGATTGRARRCGWLDAVMTRYACRLSGFTDLALTNLDGLDHLEEIKICVAYRLDGKKLHVPPADSADLARLEPIYETFPGWKKDTSSCRKYAELPLKARRYLKRITELTETPIRLISIGPKREETILL